MHFDGSKALQGSGAGVVMQSPTGEKLSYVLQIHFEATNNMAEYEALLHGLRIARDIGIACIQCCGDSDLVSQQVVGTSSARSPIMAAYRDAVDDMSLHFKGCEVKYVKREENWAADILSKLGSSRKPVLPGVFLEHLHVLSIKGADPVHPELVDSLVNTVKTIHPPWTQPSWTTSWTENFQKIR